MITELYTFSTDSFVVAEEWNANFKTLYSVSGQHEESINIGRETIAFPDSDFTQLFSVIKTQPNSHSIENNSIVVGTEQEYYGTLYSGQDLQIHIPKDMNGEARVLVYLTQDTTLKFFNITYDGTTVIEYADNRYDTLWFPSGYYYIMIYEGNDIAQVKLIWTGVQQ